MCVCVYFKGSATEREGRRKKDLLLAGSVSQWPQELGLEQTEARKSIRVSHVGGSQIRGPSSTAV